MHLAIRADGSPEIGYGHLTRSSALVDEMISRGHSVTCATTTPDAAREIYPDAADVVSLPSRGDPAPFVDWIEIGSPDIVFTDAYPIDTDYQRAIRDHVPLAVLQDDARHAVCADIFINGNLYASDIEYEFVDAMPTTYLGTDYFLLRREVRELLPADPNWRPDPSSALVTMGGSDIANLTPTIVRTFDGLDVNLTVIVGPGFSPAQERDIQAAVDDVSTAVEITRDPEDLAERMFHADVAVATASTTTYELLALGTPIVCCSVVDNQVSIADALTERDLATVLTRDDDEQAFRRAIDDYLSTPSLRRERSWRGRRLIDGDGAVRTADVITATVEQ